MNKGISITELAAQIEAKRIGGQIIDLPRSDWRELSRLAA